MRDSARGIAEGKRRRRLRIELLEGFELLELIEGA